MNPSRFICLKQTAFLLIMGFAWMIPSMSGWGKDVLIVLSGDDSFKNFASKLEAELSDYQVERLEVNTDSDYPIYKKTIETVKPKVLILLDNISVKFAQKLNQSGQSHKAIASMALNLKRLLADDPHIAGVAYEVPGYTVVSSFKKYVKPELEKIVVIYREEEFHTFVKDAKTQLASSGVELIPVKIDGFAHLPKKMNRIIKKHLTRNPENADAFWLINDNKLLTKDNFASIWITSARKNKLPILCGLKNFVNPSLGFCTFAAIPSEAGLASQVSDYVFSVIDEGALPADIGVDYLLETKFYIDETKYKHFEFSITDKHRYLIEFVK
ncbi:MAG: hypothetical protein HRU19_24820 [Pseudobacteriovorax sp.]|nr:hypothetical protein [Pseudobacteriovorax sp.]